MEAPRFTPKEIAPVIPTPKKLKDRGFLDKGPAPLKLDGAAPARARSSLADVVQKQLTAPRTVLAQAKAIDLEEVGRRAVAPPPPPAISLGSRSARRAGLKEVRSVVGQAPAPSRSVGPVDARRVNLSRRGPSSPRSGGAVVGRPGPALRMRTRPAQVRKRKVLPQKVAAVPKQVKKQEAIKVSKKKTEITGPLSERKVIKYTLPPYPEWARAQDVETAVAIRFFVSPQGKVIGNPVVQMASGYGQLDRLALEALKNWLFSPLPSSVTQENQWGIITFRFVLE